MRVTHDGGVESTFHNVVNDSSLYYTGCRPSVVDWGVVCLLAASAGLESVTRAMDAA